jgi:tetratricopeptide (TPR) repeat protein
MEKAEGELKEDRVTQALRDFEAAALLWPENPSIRERINLVSSQWDESIKRQMVQRAAAQARAQYESGNLLASRQYWKSVVELDAGNAEASSALSRIDLTLSQDDRSRLEELRRAQNATQVQQALLLAQSLRQRGQLRQALLETQKALRLFPSDKAILAIQERIKSDVAELAGRKAAEADRLSAAGDTAGAIRALETAWREDPGNSKLAEKVEALRGQLETKLTPEQRKAIEQRYYRAVEQYLKGNYDTAAKFAIEVLQADPASEAAKILKEKIEAAERLAR